MDPMRSIPLLLRPWMSYNYTVIQVVCWVELPVQRRLYPIFFENMDPDKWNKNSVVSGHPKFTKILWINRLSTGPPDFERHK